MDDFVSPASILVVTGLLGGMVLFVRGLVAHRRDRLIEAVASSSLDAIAAGEVRVSGVVEPPVMTLISPLQGRPCVWYRARVHVTGEGGRELLNDERAIEFPVAMATRGAGRGSVRPYSR